MNLPSGLTGPQSRKFLRLLIREVFKESLGDDEVERCLVGADALPQNVTFLEVRGDHVQRDIDPVVLNVRTEQLFQRRRAAANVEKLAPSFGRHVVDCSCHLLHSKMRACVLGVLVNPEIPLIDSSRGEGHGRNYLSVPGRQDGRSVSASTQTPPEASIEERASDLCQQIGHEQQDCMRRVRDECRRADNAISVAGMRRPSFDGDASTIAGRRF